MDFPKVRMIAELDTGIIDYFATILPEDLVSSLIYNLAQNEEDVLTIAKHFVSKFHEDPKFINCSLGSIYKIFEKYSNENSSKSLLTLCNELVSAPQFMETWMSKLNFI